MTNPIPESTWQKFLEWKKLEGLEVDKAAFDAAIGMEPYRNLTVLKEIAKKLAQNRVGL